MTARAVLVLAALLSAPMMVSAQGDPIVSIQEVSGGYTVSARFNVAEPPDIVRGVLTDYDTIPRFMPNVRYQPRGGTP